MRTLHHLGPSPEHPRYQALLPEFWDKVGQQQKEAVDHGYPLAGLLEFGQAWFGAWAAQSLDRLRDCMAPDCDFIDSSTFQNIRIGREETLANCAACFGAFPDMAFYPQDDSLRSLPYGDYSHGQLRVAIPWRGIARWTGPLRLPGTDIVFPPTGRCLNFIGVDRYLLTDDFRITHIDTDWDLLFMGLQLSPLGIRTPRLGYLKAASLAARAVVPLARGAGRGGTDGHRRFDLPLPSITRLEQWQGTDAEATA
ncbi:MULTISPECIES: nuclear transport factor 2 family protein [unclassified Nocardia]|uniref:nuclear transport factor 2 family protein n=1 Tax=unclassified Nocardia TaxID=2637762 RepID=UPI001CE3E84C|nr:MULTISPECIES: nuclear transport factor 2 family protein [unclassified Nocardia]